MNGIAWQPRRDYNVYACVDLPEQRGADDKMMLRNAATHMELTSVEAVTAFVVVFGHVNIVQRGSPFLAPSQKV
jgi:hypothetical protein